MEEKQATITNFLKYLKDNSLASARLVSALRNFDGYYYDYEVKKSFEDITYIPLSSLKRLRNVGKKTVDEFEILRANYLQYLSLCETDSSLKTFKEIPREKYICLLRLDILKTLETIDNDTDFVEMALLEKIERDGIKLVEYNINEMS